MSNSILSAKVLQNEAAAIAWVEARVWPEGPVCPHCGGVERISKMGGKATRIGLWKCYQCRKQFTVKVGTIFESSHVAMHLWLQAMYLLCSSKKGISSNQLSRTLGVTLKTAWFMSHRIREAMRVLGLEPMGGPDRIVEADETFIGRLEGEPKRAKGSAHKNVVLTLVERGGAARSFHVDSTSVAQIVPIVRQNIRRESKLMTDEARHYVGVGAEFASHGAVYHGVKEYVRGEAHTNIYQHCAEKHLHRYLAEYDFRYNNRIRLGVDDVERTERAVKGIVGKRLTYRAAGH